jgi:hypothetical protein
VSWPRPSRRRPPREQVPPNPTRPPKAHRSLLTQPGRRHRCSHPAIPASPAAQTWVNQCVHSSPSRLGPEPLSQRRPELLSHRRSSLGGLSPRQSGPRRWAGNLSGQDPPSQSRSSRNPSSQMRQDRKRGPRNRQTGRSGPAHRRYPPPAQQVTVVRGPWPSVRIRIWSRPRGIPAARRRPGERARLPAGWWSGARAPTAGERSGPHRSRLWIRAKTRKIRRRDRPARRPGPMPGFPGRGPTRSPGRGPTGSPSRALPGSGRARRRCRSVRPRRCPRRRRSRHRRRSGPLAGVAESPPAVRSPR